MPMSFLSVAHATMTRYLPRNHHGFVLFCPHSLTLMPKVPFMAGERVCLLGSQQGCGPVPLTVGAEPYSGRVASTQSCITA